MQVTETKSESLKREFQITLPAADLTARIDDRLAEVAKTAKIPGFRPGKIPPAVLKQRYGDSVMGEVLEKAVNETSGEIMKEREIRPAMQPKIEITKFEKGSDLEYTMAVELMPDIDPGDFSKIKLERLVTKVDEGEVEETLKRMASAQKASDPAKEGKKAETGDVAVIDFVGSVDGTEFEGGAGEGYELELGSNSFIPGFEDQIIGTKAADQLDVKVTFPKEYGAEDLAGKDAVFKVTVKELRVTKPAAIDDELAKKMGMNTLDDLKKAIRETHAGEFENMSKLRLKRALLDEMADIHDFDVPAGLVEQEAEDIWKQFDHAREHDHLDPEMKDDNKSDDERREEFAEIATRRVRLGLLMSEIGRLNKIEVSQEDINRAMIAEAQKYPGQEQQVLEFYKKSPEAMQQLTAPVYEGKVVDLILEKVELKEKEVTPEELLKEPDAPLGAKTGGDKKKPAKKKAAAKKKTAAKKK